MYWCENCSLLLMEKHQMRVFEHRVQSQDIWAKKVGSDRRLEKTA